MFWLEHIRHGICSSHLTLCLTQYFIFGYCSRTCPDLKISVYIFCSYLLVTKHFAHKTFCVNVGVNGKRISSWSVFAIEPIWYLSDFGLQTLKEWITWPLCKGWISFSRKTYCIVYYCKKNFILINICNRI